MDAELGVERNGDGPGENWGGAEYEQYSLYRSLGELGKMRKLPSL